MILRYIGNNVAIVVHIAPSSYIILASRVTIMLSDRTTDDFRDLYDILFVDDVVVCS